MLKRFYFSTLMMLLAAAMSLNAQITTSSMTGVITDDANEPLIGAVVKACTRAHRELSTMQ